MAILLRPAVARQAAIVAAIGALHLGAFMLVTLGTPLRVELPPAWPGPIDLLPPAPVPAPESRPEPVEALAHEPGPVLPPDVDFPPPVSAGPVADGMANAVSTDAGRGPGEPATDLRAPALRTRDTRLQALIDACYPSVARRLGQEGRGVAQVVVGTDGQASRWSVARTTGFAELDPGMGCVVRRVQFEPGRRDGSAIEAAVLMPISFRLR